jgi:hypothetical protein
MPMSEAIKAPPMMVETQKHDHTSDAIEEPAMQVQANPRVSIDAELEDWRCRDPTVCSYWSPHAAQETTRWDPFLETSQGSSMRPLKFVYPLNEVAIANASAPHGYVGNREHLHDALLRAAAGELINVVVLGTSVTLGTRVGGVEGSAWPHVLGVLAQRANLSMNVTNMAAHAGSTFHYLSYLHDLVPQLLNADIVIVDVSVMDSTDNDPQRFKGIETSTDMLASSLLGFGGAVVYLETFPYDQVDPGRPRKEACDIATNMSNSPHWKPLQDLQVPVVSYPLAVCQHGEPYWDLHYKFDGRIYGHPLEYTHELIAELLLGSFLQVTQQTTADIVETAPDTRETHIGSECALHPKMAQVHATNSWRYYEDIPGKPGWISKSPGHITFSFGNDSVDVIMLEYLKTYENIGNATCWLANEPDQKIILDGLWHLHMSGTFILPIRVRSGKSIEENHYSQSVVAGWDDDILWTLTPERFPERNDVKVNALQPFTTELECRSHGDKVKIVNVMGC